jgi:hypothetical protein
MHVPFRRSQPLSNRSRKARRLHGRPVAPAMLLACLTLGSGAAVLNGTPALAQGATTGAIGGTVTDSNGARVPGVSITVKNLGTAAERTTRANGAGEFRIPELEPGQYQVTITADGFQSFQANDVTVSVGGLAALQPKLNVGSVSEKVEVSGDLPPLNVNAAEFSTTIDQAAIDNLPINGRRYSDFALLTPGVVSNSDGFGLLSFRGISFLLNENTVDGADDNQAYFSEARGRTRLAYAITQVAVQEFQVNTSNYSAQYGRSAGGVINTVTKSGTNKLHGEAFFYDRDNSLGGATNPYTLLNVANGTGGYTSQPFKPTDWRKQYGFGLGGPLLRDKLFFFYAFDQSRRNFPAVARSTDPNDLFAQSSAILPAGETCSPTAFTATALTYQTEGDYNACALSAAYGLNSFQAGSAYYTQGLGIINSYLGFVPRTADQVINFPKIDYQINDRERLSFLYNRLRYSSPNGLYSQATITDGNDANGNDFAKEDFGIARLTSILSNSVVNDALVQYGRDFEYTYADAPSPNNRPLSNNSYGRSPSLQVGYNFGSGVYSGTNSNLNRYADPDERRLQLLDGLTWSHGKHVTKFGLEYNKVSDFVNNLYNGNGSYSWDYGYTFISDYLNATTGLGGPNYTQLYYSFNQSYGNPVGEIATREYAGYATDDWRILPNLTLTLGVRYDYEYIPPNPFPNTGNPALMAVLANEGPPYSTASTALPQTAYRPDDRNNVAPRFGFAWNAYGNGKTFVRGGFGVYYGRIINSNILQTYEESGSPNGQISFTNSLYPGGHCGPTFPALYASAAAVYSCLGANSLVPNSTVAYLDPHMQNPQVEEADFSVEQSLGHNTALSVTYLSSFGHELPTAIDTNFSTISTYNYTFTAGVAAAATAARTSYPISATDEATLSAYPQPAQSGYVTLPHGGRPLPLKAGQQFTTKVFLQPYKSASNTRPDPAYGQILDVRSDVNSNYNALAVQVNHRYQNGVSLLANYTWSHALDENPYESTVVPTYSIYDPTNRRLEYGNSATNVPNRGVVAVVYQPQTHFHGLKDYALGGWRIAPLLQMQNGLPYTPYVSGTVSGLTVPNGIDGCTLAVGCAVNPAYKGLNGSGSSANRLPIIERNSYEQPRTIVLDVRLGKNFYFHAPHLQGTRFEIFAEIFNAANHQNITAVQNDAYTISSPTTLTPYAGSNQFGTNTNSNSNYTYSPRQLQLSGRFHF